jgi:hypothetical protein
MRERHETGGNAQFSTPNAQPSTGLPAWAWALIGAGAAAALGGAFWLGKRGGGR